MQIFFISILSLIVIGLAGFIFFILKQQKSDNNTEQNNSMIMMQNQINQLSQMLDNRMSESTKILDNKLTESARAMQAQFGQSAKIVRDVTEHLTKLDETNKRVVGFTEQLESLQNTLTNPKHRGVLGEYYLETVLKNVLPPSNYQMQYDFGDGDIVDAVIFVEDKIIPIDSKFSLENYNRIAQEQDALERVKLEKQFKSDLKMRIDETSKYIKPNKKTMDFAFMFIPAEGIYYDLLVNQVGAIKVNTRDLIEYAFRDKHVIIVSPTSFHAYLQTVLQGLRALQIEKSAVEIRKEVEKLGRHLRSYEDYLKKMGNNLGTTVNMYNNAYKEFGKIDKDVIKISGGKSELEMIQIEKPVIE
ncbi:DNA recombination protein RmuC [Patescibacteria group bacterium]